MANSFEHISICAVKVLAKQAALRLVKDQLQRQGIRVHSVAARDIHIRAHALVDEHPELIEQARERAVRLGMYERRRAAQKSRHSRNSKVRANSGLLLNASHAQNGSGE